MNRGGRKSAMDRWEDTQRLKLMSKKISEAQSVLKKEKIIGGVIHPSQRKATRPGADFSGVTDDSAYSAPYDVHANSHGPTHGANLGQRQMVVKQARPQWDAGHKSYTEVEKAKNTSREPRARLSPMHVKKGYKTPQAVRGGLIKGLERAERIMQKVIDSPKKTAGGQAADHHYQQLKALRESLCMDHDDVGHVGNTRKVAGVGNAKPGPATTRKAPVDMAGLRQSISMLSNIIDWNLEELLDKEAMDETECEVNLGSPSGKDRARCPSLMDGHQVADGNHPVKENGGGGRQQEYDDDEVFDDDDKQYQGDSFDQEDGEGDDLRVDGDFTGLPDEEVDAVISELMQTQAKISQLERIFTPQGTSAPCAPSPKTAARVDVAQATAGEAPVQRLVQGQASPAEQAPDAASSDAVEPEVSLEKQTPVPVAVAASAPRATKPFSFKLRANTVDPGGSQQVQQQDNPNTIQGSIFSGGIQLLNSQASRKPFALAPPSLSNLSKEPTPTPFASNSAIKIPLGSSSGVEKQYAAANQHISAPDGAELSSCTETPTQSFGESQAHFPHEGANSKQQLASQVSDETGLVKQVSGDAYQAAHCNSSRPKRGARGMLSLFGGNHTPETEASSAGGGAGTMRPFVSFIPQEETVTPTAAPPSLLSSPLLQLKTSALLHDSTPTSALIKTSADVGHDSRPTSAAPSMDASSTLGLDVDDRTGVLSRAETERKKVQSAASSPDHEDPKRDNSATGRKRINAADIKRAMLAAEQSRGKDLEADVRPPILDDSRVPAPSARLGRGPFKPVTPARFSAAKPLFQKPLTGYDDDDDDTQEMDERQISGPQVKCPRGGGWAVSICGADVEGSLDVIDAI